MRLLAAHAGMLLVRNEPQEPAPLRQEPAAQYPRSRGGREPGFPAAAGKKTGDGQRQAARDPELGVIMKKQSTGMRLWAAVLTIALGFGNEMAWAAQAQGDPLPPPQSILNA